MQRFCKSWPTENALILFIQTLALYKSFTYLLTCLQRVFGFEMSLFLRYVCRISSHYFIKVFGTFAENNILPGLYGMQNVRDLCFV